MTQTEKLVNRLPNDIGGLPAEPIRREDHELEPWEKRCHALADVLDFHKIINTEEKRCGVEALGAEMIGGHLEKWRLPSNHANLICDFTICGLGDDGTAGLF
jgi:hypothetical protein